MILQLSILLGGKRRVTNELITKPIEELSFLIKNKQLTPVDLADAVIRQAEKYNGQINAYISKTADNAREIAGKLEKEIMDGHYRGPLHGIPLAIKDNFYVKGEVTTMGSQIQKDFLPNYTATIVSK